MRASLGRIDDLAARGEEIFLTVVLGLLSLLIVLAVVFRYVVNDPLTWSEELIILMFVWVVFIGTAHAFRMRSHIVIDVILLFAPLWVRVMMGAISAAATLAVLVAVGWYGWHYTMRELPNLSPMLGISSAWSVAPLVACCVLSVLHILRRLADEGPQSAVWVDAIPKE